MTQTTPELAHGDTDFDAFGDGESIRCTWSELVCPETPTHFVVFAEHAGGGDAHLFCGRHYVLTLAHMVEVHVPACTAGLDEHILRHGSLTV